MGEFAIDETSYSKTMKEIQPVDKVEAAFVNAIIGTLLNNDAYILKQVLNKIDIKSIIQDVDINDKNKIPSSAVTHLLKEQMDSLTLSAIQKTDIVQNAATDKTDKVVSAAVVKNLQDQITEQNTNRLKVKTKAYRVEVAFDSNIGKYEGHIVNTDFLKDFPTGTIVATLVTGHDMHGYGLHNATWSIFDNNLIANATMAGTYNATVTWLYL